jgi:hypothetical protein
MLVLDVARRIVVIELMALDVCCSPMSFGKFARCASDFVLKSVPILDDAIPSDLAPSDAPGVR